MMTSMVLETPLQAEIRPVRPAGFFTPVIHRQALPSMAGGGRNTRPFGEIRPVLL